MGGKTITENGHQAGDTKASVFLRI
jgi:hypothetical protein